jgi:RND family efflux transporter MFP subunit
MLGTSFLLGLALSLFPAVADGDPVRRDQALASHQAQPALEIKGYVVPVASVLVAPSVPGRVTELLIEDGMQVEKGAVLARLDPTPYALAHKSAQLRVAVARARLEVARARSREEEKVPKEQLKVVQAELALAEAEAERSAYQLDATQVRAPISGTILAKKAEVGSLVNAGAFNGAYGICEMADMTKLEIEAAIPERDVRRIAKGQRCQILLDAYPDTLYQGQVARLLPVADRAKGALPVRVRIDLPQGDYQLRPDLGARVTFLGK